MIGSVLVKAMVLNGLGFVQRTLYLMPRFFEDKPVERLLGPGVLAEHLNDDALGRALDAIHLESRIRDYIVNVVDATRHPARYGLKLETLIRYGASPRANDSRMCR